MLILGIIVCWLFLGWLGGCLNKYLWLKEFKTWDLEGFSRLLILGGPLGLLSMIINYIVMYPFNINNSWFFPRSKK